MQNAQVIHISISFPRAVSSCKTGLEQRLRGSRGGCTEMVVQKGTEAMLITTVLVNRAERLLETRMENTSGR